MEISAPSIQTPTRAAAVAAVVVVPAHAVPAAPVVAAARNAVDAQNQNRDQNVVAVSQNRDQSADVASQNQSHDQNVATMSAPLTQHLSHKIALISISKRRGSEFGAPSELSMYSLFIPTQAAYPSSVAAYP